MMKLYKNILISSALLTLWYISVTADYTWLTKNTWDTLTATNWNQLVDNVKGIQTGSNGNVGIGTSIPEAMLHLKNSSAPEWLRIDAYANTWLWLEISNSYVSGSNIWKKWRLMSYWDWSFQLKNQSDNITTLVSDPNGNIGIWTTNPSYKLQVVDSQHTTYPITVPEIYFQTDDSANTNVWSTLWLWWNYNWTIQQTPFGYISWVKENATQWDKSWNLVFSTRVNSITPAKEHMRILSNGNVWIWTINPKSKLAVSWLPSGATSSVVNGDSSWLAGTVCVTNNWNMYIDTDGSCAD